MSNNNATIIERTINYLSNLFTRINFKNKNDTNIVKVGTNDYFDKLEIEGDDWIKFNTSILTPSAMEPTETFLNEFGETQEEDLERAELLKQVNIIHNETNYYTDNTSQYLGIDEAGHIIKIANANDSKVFFPYYITDDGNGNLAFSLIKPNSENSNGGS